MRERDAWGELRGQRLSRRRLLSISAKAGVGAVGLVLVGCGGDDDDAAPQAEEPPQPEPQAQQAPQAQVEPQAEPEPEPVEQAEAPAPEEEPAAEPQTLTSVADTTIYADAPSSNGAGMHMFVGRSNSGQERRALVRFDTSEIPADAQVTAAALTLAMSRTVGPAGRYTLHRLTKAWGESASDAEANEGRGADAAEGDATWAFATFESDPWDTEGGDFEAAPSATMEIGDLGPYVFEGEGMVADVQAWISGEAENHGWILIGESTENQTAKRFDTRESEAPPMLEVTFEAAGVSSSQETGGATDAYAY